MVELGTRGIGKLKIRIGNKDVQKDNLFSYYSTESGKCTILSESLGPLITRHLRHTKDFSQRYVGVRILQP